VTGTSGDLGASGADVGGPGGALDRLVAAAGRPSLFAPSAFVKRVDCPRCGAPKQLPSPTAYLYCDHCGSLIDYDFRAANAGTSAGLTNTVFHRLLAPVQGHLQAARAVGDVARYRQLYSGVYTEWIRQCPQAVSPRARTDDDFRARMVYYLVESTVRKDFDPELAALEQQLNQATARLGRVPRGDLPWLVHGDFGLVAGAFRRLMEATYRALEVDGVLALDPDQAPPGVPVRMEYSTFCQGWLPHLEADNGQRLLAWFGLAAEYGRVSVPAVVPRRCGGCGSEVLTVPSARTVVCDTCGRRLDVAGGECSCRSCGSLLCFPDGVREVACPSCRTLTHRT